MNTLKKINREFFILLAIAMLGFNSMAQDESDCIKTRGTANKPCFAVSADKMNVLYAGLPNPVTVAASVAPEKLHISWGGATANCTGRGKYDLSVPDSLAGKAITITLYTKRKIGKPKFLGEVIFRVKPIPDPEILISGNITEGRHPKVALLANPFVCARIGQDFNLTLRWHVLSYSVSFFIMDGIQEPPITVKGAQFGEEVTNKIIKAPSGTIIAFSDFEIRSVAGYRSIQKLIIIRIE